MGRGEPPRGASALGLHRAARPLHVGASQHHRRGARAPTVVPLLGQVQEAMRWVQNLCDLDPDREDPTPSLASVLQTRCVSPADLAHPLITVPRGWGFPHSTRLATSTRDFQAGRGRWS